MKFPMHPLLQTLYAKYVASSLDKQLSLQQIVGETRGEIDLASGTIAFADKYRWRVQILGIESAEPKRWLWAWACEKGGTIPERLLRAAEALRGWGERKGIDSLTRPEVDAPEIDGAAMAAIACGSTGSRAFYRAPYEGGGVFVLIRDDSYPPLPAYDPILRISHIYSHVVQTCAVNHRQAFEGYVKYYGLRVKAIGTGTIVGKARDGAAVEATFDEAGRLLRFESTLAPYREPASAAGAVNVNGDSSAIGLSASSASSILAAEIRV